MYKITEAEIMEAVEVACNEIFDTDNHYTHAIMSRVSEIVEEKVKLKKEETKEKSATTTEKQVVIAVHDPDKNLLKGAVDAYIIQMQPSIYRLGKGSEEFAPEMWDASELEARLAEFFYSVHYKKGGHKLVHFEDYMEAGNKKEAKRWGLNIKTKLPVLCLPVAPELPAQTVDDGKEITENINVIVEGNERQ